MIREHILDFFICSKRNANASLALPRIKPMGICLKWENMLGLHITHSEFLTNLFNHNNTVLSGHAPVTLVIAIGEDFPSLPQDRDSFPYCCRMKTL